jgi:hypothetical protein
VNNEVGVERHAANQRRHRQGQQAGGETDEAARDLALPDLPMLGGRRHQQAHGQRDQKEGREVQHLLGRR